MLPGAFPYSSTSYRCGGFLRLSCTRNSSWRNRSRLPWGLGLTSWSRRTVCGGWRVADGMPVFELPTATLFAGYADNDVTRISGLARPRFRASPMENAACDRSAEIARAGIIPLLSGLSKLALAWMAARRLR